MLAAGGFWNRSARRQERAPPFWFGSFHVPGRSLANTGRITTNPAEKSGHQ
jgi:hypothetical protein